MNTQPMQSRWEEVPREREQPGSVKGRVTGGAKVGSRAWGVAWVDTVMELPSEEEEYKRHATMVKHAEEMEAAENAERAAHPSRITSRAASRAVSIHPA